MGAGILPAHKKSYQLGVLATPVQIRTDPFLSLGHDTLILRIEIGAVPVVS